MHENLPLLPFPHHQAKAEGIRILDFLSDFDRLHHGTISKPEFIRGIKVPFPQLNVDELRTLEHVYACADDGQMAEYRRFVDDVEAAFTIKGLESQPTAVPMPFDARQANASVSLAAFMSPEQTSLVDGVLTRLSKRIKERRQDLLSVLRDLDTGRNVRGMVFWEKEWGA